ncbi:hypothetical protein CN984_17685 [Bacillus cereus]|uniref:Uncharacterized protein n=1 Tax=Bacillus cereus TaxID=1396 RepID=A0A2B9PSL7_BACCE|nr:hypothetical protein [Bacillus cereus]PGO26402.1 hypothetical protein CN984_17685 [Bacillus cereus]
MRKTDTLKKLESWDKLPTVCMKYLSLIFSIFLFITSFIDKSSSTSEYIIVRGTEWIPLILKEILIIPNIDIFVHGAPDIYYDIYTWTIPVADINRLKASIFLFCIALIMPRFYFKNHPYVMSFVRFFYFIDSFYIFHTAIDHAQHINEQLQINNATYLWIVAIVIATIDLLIRLLQNGFFATMKKYISIYAKNIRFVLLIISIIIFLTCFFLLDIGKDPGATITIHGEKWLMYETPPLIYRFYPMIESIFLFCIAFVMPKYYFKNHPYVMSFTRFFYFVVSFFLIVFFINSIQHEIAITLNITFETLSALYLFCFIFACAIAMIDLLIRLSRNVKDPREAKGFISKMSAYLSLFIPLLTCLLFPNCVFGYCYWLGLMGLPGQDTFIQPTDAYYLSFVINYALPISDEKILKSISAINTNTLLRIIEIIHITIYRIIDLTIIAVAIKTIHELIEIKDKNIEEKTN